MITVGMMKKALANIDDHTVITVNVGDNKIMLAKSVITSLINDGQNHVPSLTISSCDKSICSSSDVSFYNNLV